MPRFTPEEWLCAALSVRGAAENFKVVSIEHVGPVVVIQVLHKESGAVWEFASTIVREGVV